MKTRIVAALAITGALLTLSACSSSPSSDGSGDDLPAADAGTDTVPGDSTQVPSAGPTGSSDGTALAAPPADPATAPSAPTSSPGPDMAAATTSAPSSPADQPPPAPTAPAPETASPATASAAEVAPAPAAVSDAAPSSSNPSSSPEGESYTVRSGDTLMKIAFESYGDLYKWREIYEANRDQIKNPNWITPGTVLKIAHAENNAPTRHGEKYQIKQGDTLGTISNEVYGTPRKWKKIWHNNRDLIKDPNRIFAGFYLYYTVSPEERDEKEQINNSPAPLAGGPPAQDSPPQDKPTAMAPATPSTSGDSRGPASVKTAAPPAADKATSGS